MTYCSTIAKPLLKRIEAGKTLNEIGAELCGKSVKNPRQKAIRLIRELLGEETLVQYAETLKYSTEKAELSKKRKPATQRKISASASGGSKHKQPDMQEESACADFTLIEAVRLLIEDFGYDAVFEAVKQEGEKLQIKEN